jgi:hypothetical protein
MLLTVILITTLPELNKVVPNLHTLFTNNVNFMMLLVITICIILLDIPSGIMFALFVIYGSYYYQKTGFKNIKFESNLKPVKLNSGDVPNSMLRLPTEKRLLEPFSSSQSSDAAPVDNCCNIPITTPKTPLIKSRSSYDVVGCYLNGMQSAQNTTTFGPPLSSDCYLTEDGVAKTATGWYPINP